MAVSAVPDAVKQLLALLDTAAGPLLNGVRIMDGPPGPNFSDRERINIGWAPGTDQAVEIQQGFASAGARRRDEDFNITCYAEVSWGDTRMDLRRQRLFAILDGVDKVLRNSGPAGTTLNGSVQWAHLTVASLAQVQDPDGAMASAVFTVSCRARI
ncbi:hypothetical protein [Streptomyces sp. sk226]|uniref:hypothetical protein n=1 Tax=Streptomyces sp. sk226 TaxID=2034268 RepID=UPI000BF01423|nr:hypothetical protein [Streptomyces sp. sk226]